MTVKNQVPFVALSLTQPWASLVVCGEKRIETRSWPTKVRGVVAIHASAGMPRECIALLRREPFQSALQRANVWTGPDGTLPRGLVLGVVTLTDCQRFGDDEPRSTFCPAPHEEDFGDFGRGRYGFALADVTALPRPLPARGALGFWKLPDDVRRGIADGLGWQL